MAKYQGELIPRKEADKVGLVGLVGGLFLEQHSDGKLVMIK